jgi:alkyl hydroperoxide reductase subunit AhpC
LNALLEQFDAVNTQVLGLSVNSKNCHKGWANTFGGIKLPLLADFHPKGAVAKSYGLWVEEDGTSDRATVLIDKNGKVLWAHSVTPDGAREPVELLEKVRSLL